jgi:hypothetical protein
MNSRINNIKLGILLGIIAPALSMLVIYLFKFSEYNFQELINMLIARGIFTKIVSLCVIPNLAFFFLFLNRNYYYSARGVLISTILFAFFVFVTNFTL